VGQQLAEPAFWKYKTLFLEMGWQTLWRTVAGLLLAVVFGTLIGIIIGFSRIARDALYPLLVGFNAIPKATLVPVISLIFIGQHDFNTVLMAFMISFFPIAVSVGIGLSTLEPEYRDILRALGASRFAIFWKIALPKTLPGLGALFKSGETNGDYPLMFAVLIALAFLGIVLYYAVIVLERYFAGWAEREAG